MIHFKKWTWTPGLIGCFIPIDFRGYGNWEISGTKGCIALFHCLQLRFFWNLEEFWGPLKSVLKMTDVPDLYIPRTWTISFAINAMHSSRVWDFEKHDFLRQFSSGLCLPDPALESNETARTRDLDFFKWIAVEKQPLAIRDFDNPFGSNFSQWIEGWIIDELDWCDQARRLFETEEISGSMSVKQLSPLLSAMQSHFHHDQMLLNRVACVWNMN